MWQAVQARLKKYGAWILLGVLIGLIIGLAVAGKNREASRATTSYPSWREYPTSQEHHLAAQLIFYEDTSKIIRAGAIRCTRFEMYQGNGYLYQNARLLITNGLPIDLTVEQLRITYYFDDSRSSSETVEVYDSFTNCYAESDNVLHIALRHPDRHRAARVAVQVQKCRADNWRTLRITHNRKRYILLLWSNTPVDQAVAEMLKSDH
jgi:hypothetical protein